MGTRYFACMYIDDQNIRVICVVKKLLELVVMNTIVLILLSLQHTSVDV